MLKNPPETTEIVLVHLNRKNSKLHFKVYNLFCGFLYLLVDLVLANKTYILGLYSFWGYKYSRA